MRPLDRQRHLTRRIQIVPFRLRHLERILWIERASFGKQAWPRALFLELYRDWPELFLAAKLGGRIAGYLAASTEKRTAEIVSLAVHPQYRRSGVADALLRHVLHKLRKAGLRRVELMVRPGNIAAQELYGGFGFREGRLARRYYEDGGDGLQMTRALQ
ncbi:MAG TPA: ribosomal protein S18-alanine N-acetyltransferase [Bryobacteraceae bacterium]|nr:ribosomal protein S18-alanine N-acetyltransferase [Bryobacteraceae bacterium]